MEMCPQQQTHEKRDIENMNGVESNQGGTGYVFAAPEQIA
jgi:hypothetical protein